MSDAQLVRVADAWLVIGAFLELEDIATLHRVCRRLKATMESIMLWEVLLERDAPPDLFESVRHETTAERPLDEIAPGTSKELYRVLRLSGTPVLREMNRVPTAEWLPELRLDVQIRWMTMRPPPCGISLLAAAPKDASWFRISTDDRVMLENMKLRLLQSYSSEILAPVEHRRRQRFDPSHADVKGLLRRTSPMARCIEGVSAARTRCIVLATMGMCLMAHFSRSTATTPASDAWLSTPAPQGLGWLKNCLRSLARYNAWVLATPFRQGTALSAPAWLFSPEGRIALNPMIDVTRVAFVALGFVRAAGLSSSRQISRDRFALVGLLNVLAFGVGEALLHRGLSAAVPFFFRLSSSTVTGFSALFAVTNAGYLIFSGPRTLRRVLLCCTFGAVAYFHSVRNFYVARTVMHALERVWPAAAPIQPSQLCLAGDDSDGASSELASLVVRFWLNVALRQCERKLTYCYAAPSQHQWTHVEPLEYISYFNVMHLAFNTVEEALGLALEVTTSIGYGNPLVGALARGVATMAQTVLYTATCAVMYRRRQDAWWT